MLLKLKMILVVLLSYDAALFDRHLLCLYILDLFTLAKAHNNSRCFCSFKLPSSVTIMDEGTVQYPKVAKIARCEQI